MSNDSVLPPSPNAFVVALALGPGVIDDAVVIQVFARFELLEVLTKEGLQVLFDKASCRELGLFTPMTFEERSDIQHAAIVSGHKMCESFAVSLLSTRKCREAEGKWGRAIPLQADDRHGD